MEFRRQSELRISDRSNLGYPSIRWLSVIRHHIAALTAIGMRSQERSNCWTDKRIVTRGFAAQTFSEADARRRVPFMLLQAGNSVH